MKALLVIALGLSLAGCASQQPEKVVNERRLPIAVANNAVTISGEQALSFGGLLSGKTWQDVTSRAFACQLYAGTCREIAGLPDGVGRLASVAVQIDGLAYIFGGYTVAEDGTEKSTPDVWQFDIKKETYRPMASIPVPVDDAVAAVSMGRYVYLVSGWHDHDNVDLVQVFDTKTDRWFTATPFPGKPVFGHAGGIAKGKSGEVLVICDGVKVVPPKEAGKRRTFAGSPECWRGELDSGDPAQIHWSILRAQAPAHYRMAATGVGALVVFAGGSDNPYNYNGIGYNGVPSTASARVEVYDANADKFLPSLDKEIPSMDHRGLIEVNGQFMILGGMGADGVVLDQVQVFGPVGPVE